MHMKHITVCKYGKHSIIASYFHYILSPGPKLIKGLESCSSEDAPFKNQARTSPYFLAQVPLAKELSCPTPLLRTLL